MTTSADSMDSNIQDRAVPNATNGELEASNYMVSNPSSEVNNPGCLKKCGEFGYPKNECPDYCVDLKRCIRKCVGAGIPRVRCVQMCSTYNPAMSGNVAHQEPEARDYSISERDVDPFCMQECRHDEIDETECEERCYLPIRALSQDVTNQELEARAERAAAKSISDFTNVARASDGVNTTYPRMTSKYEPECMNGYLEGA